MSVKYVSQERPTVYCKRGRTGKSPHRIADGVLELLVLEVRVFELGCVLIQYMPRNKKIFHLCYHFLHNSF